MNPKLLFSIIILFVFYACSRVENLVELKSEQLTIGIDTKGNVSSLIDNTTQIDYLSKDTASPLITIKKDSEMKYPVLHKF